ncbi:glycosyltransferase family 4 protein [Methylophilaceae bacterium]|nr:glycosyltransferase family 4 protein [Methylophilaceae bacterium]|tara:strand:- start:2742 stop:3857 length:1116 start_codon:yes stop_codon:yes gene_type:complete
MIKNKKTKLTVLQILPELNSGGVERGTLEVARFLVSRGHKSLVISGGGRMQEDLRKEGSKHFQWSIGKKSLFTLKYVPILARFLLNNKVDILHARSRFPAWICFLALKIIPIQERPKFITTFHGPYSVNFYSAIMTKGDKVIVISKTIKKYVLKNYKLNSHKLFLNYRGVDSAQFPYHFKPKETWIKDWYQYYPETKNKILLTMPGRITRWKGQEDFIEIIAKLRKNHSNIIGLIVGDVKSNKKNFLNELKQKVEQLGVEKNIVFIEHRSDLREIMSISKIVFSLSKEPEAFGRTTIESLKLGIPVIGYSHGGVGEQLKEVFPQGQIGRKNKGQAVLLASKWIIDPPKVAYSKLFSLNEMLENTLKVYESA